MNNNKYKTTKTTVSLINYHLVFCPRYRRKIFKIEGVKERFKELTLNECKKQRIDILSIECQQDYVHMVVNVYPQQSIPDVVRKIKGATSITLKEEFPMLSAMPSLWTRNYFVSTASSISPETIDKYVHAQKNRP